MGSALQRLKRLQISANAICRLLKMRDILAVNTSEYLDRRKSILNALSSEYVRRRLSSALVPHAIDDLPRQVQFPLLDVNARLSEMVSLVARNDQQLYITLCNVTVRTARM